MNDSRPLVPTEVATSILGFTTPDTQELIPAVDGTSNTLALMPPVIDGQRNQIGHPENVTPTLTRPLAGSSATPGPLGPSLTYSPTQYNQTMNVAVDARSLSVTEVWQEAQRNSRLQRTCRFTARNNELNNGMKKLLPTWKTRRDQRLLAELSEYQARLAQESAEAGNCRTEITAMKNAYARELDARTRMAADQLTEEFEASFCVYEQNQQMRFANTEEEMQSQKGERWEQLPKLS